MRLDHEGALAVFSLALYEYGLAFLLLILRRALFLSLFLLFTLILLKLLLHLLGYFGCFSPPLLPLRVPAPSPSNQNLGVSAVFIEHLFEKGSVLLQFEGHYSFFVVTVNNVPLKVPLHKLRCHNLLLFSNSALHAPHPVYLPLPLNF